MTTFFHVKACARCGLEFHCGPDLAHGRPGCWCNHLPILRETTGKDCLCPSCLAEAVAAEPQAF